MDNQEIALSEDQLKGQLPTFKEYPIFIGSDNQDVLNKVDEFVKTLSDDTVIYELAVMSKELFDKSMENWYLSKLSKEQRDTILSGERDELMRQEAYNAACNLISKIQALQRESFTFHARDLKMLISKNIDRQLSNKQIDELLGLLLGYGYAIDTTPEEEKHYNKLYSIKISEESRLQSFESSRKRLLSDIDDRNKQIEVLNKEIETVKENIEKQKEAIPSKADEIEFEEIKEELDWE